MAARETVVPAGARREGATQRVRVGLTGLAFVFLLVMLATAFLGAGRDTGAAATPARNASELSEPLAQLGVVPGNPVVAESTQPAHPAGAARR